MGIGYYRGEIPEFKPAHYKPKAYTWLINILGYIGYIVGILYVLYGSAFIIIEDYRKLFLGQAFASFISAFLIYYLSKYLIANYGVKHFYVSENAIVFKSPLRSPMLISKQEIIHIEVERPNPALSILPLTSPTLVIATYDKLHRIRTSRWENQEKLLDKFENLSLDIRDDFAIYYHRSKTTLYSFFIRMSQDTAGIIGLTIITIYLFFAIWGGIAMLVDGIRINVAYTTFLRNPEFLNYKLEGYSWETAVFQPPSGDFWFGTDWIGRDIFSRLIFGTTFTFLIALTGSLISIFIVITLGITSAYFVGWYDTIVTRISDALLTFPPFIPLILISTIATPIRRNIPGGYFFAVFIGMSFFTWPLGTRIIRSEVIKLLSNDYVLASKQIGAGDWFILRTHILPKIIPTVLILFTYTFADIILGITLLGFIGMDSESTLTWGSDLAKAVQYGEDLSMRWWTILFPTFWIFIIVFGLHLFSDSIRDVLDPKLRGGEKAIPLEFRQELDQIALEEEKRLASNKTKEISPFKEEIDQ